MIVVQCHLPSVMTNDFVAVAQMSEIRRVLGSLGGVLKGYRRMSTCAEYGGNIWRILDRTRIERLDQIAVRDQRPRHKGIRRDLRDRMGNSLLYDFFDYFFDHNTPRQASSELVKGYV